MQDTTGSTELLQLQYEVTAEDRSQAESAMMHAQFGKGGKGKVLWWVFMPTLFVFLLYRFYVDVLPDGWIWGVVFIVAWIVIFVRMRLESKKGSETISLSVRDDGLVITTRFGQARVEWSMLSDHIETADLLLLRDATSKERCYIVPKRSFASEQQAQWFRGFLDERIGTSSTPTPALSQSLGSSHGIKKDSSAF